jgi:cysteinyl-tRNA synthetase
MYVCGPTVYDFLHIGNARALVVFDSIKRFLEHVGYKVIYVQNFTDIDDKIINKAIRENVSCNDIAEKFIREAKIDMLGLNLKQALNPRATQEIDSMIEMINLLIKKKCAYRIENSIYFDTTKYKNYGRLSKKKLNELMHGNRVEIDLNKKNPNDFILWKESKISEIGFNSPWGFGRPGWHIECSAMSKKYLGEEIDIHAGGEDLIFPHHENEIAQSESCSGKTFSRYWLHNGFINIDDKKMSKSENNFFTIREISKEFSYMAIRFFILSSHYRSPINFTKENLKSSQNSYERIKNCLNNIYFYLEQNLNTSNINRKELEVLQNIDKEIFNFNNYLADDFNTSKALASFFIIIKYINININGDSSNEFIKKLKDIILILCEILGFKFDSDTKIKKNNDEINRKVLSMLKKRDLAKKNKDWILADQIRDDLKKMGIKIEDTANGTRIV